MNIPYLVTRHTRAAQAAEHWAAQYKIGTRKATVWPEKIKANRRLVELGTSPDPDAVNEVIGNTSWTEVRCDQCGCEVDAVVVVGRPRDYESATAEICLPCIEAACAVFGERPCTK